jgi:hypothetical protein
MKNLLLFTFIYWLLAIGYSPVLAEEYPVCTEELPRPDVEKGPTRQYPCNTCYEKMPEPVSLFCGDLFQAQDRVTYLQNEGEEDPPHWVTKTWEGNLEIDLTDTELPLVGKADLMIENRDLEHQIRLQEYLADYFEGPVFFDYQPVDLENDEPEIVNEELKRVATTSGVFRKLAARSLQDKLKENLIFRATDDQEPQWPGPTDKVHNYIVCYVKNSQVVDPETPDSEPIRLKDFLGHTRPIKDSFDSFKEYYQAVDAWKEEKIKGVNVETLWHYVPMFTREDVPGRVDLELEKEHDDDSLEITSPENQKILLPHLARLYEVSTQVHKLLHRAMAELTAFKQPLIAQPQDLPSSHSKVLSATEPTPIPDFGFCDYEDEALTNPGDKICGQVITANLSLTERFENPHYGEPPTPTPPSDPCDPPECDDPSECPTDYFCLNHCCLAPIPPKEYSLDVERKIDVLVKIPFLDELWEKIVVGKEKEGSIVQSIAQIFFRDEPELDFNDYDFPGMGSTIYRYNGSTNKVKAGENKSGDEAKIYFKHLGGIRCIRDKIVRKLLPSSIKFEPFCEM